MAVCESWIMPLISHFSIWSFNMLSMCFCIRIFIKNSLTEKKTKKKIKWQSDRGCGKFTGTTNSFPFSFSAIGSYFWYLKKKRQKELQILQIWPKKTQNPSEASERFNPVHCSHWPLDNSPSSDRVHTCDNTIALKSLMQRVLFSSFLL